MGPSASLRVNLDLKIIASDANEPTIKATGDNCCRKKKGGVPSAVKLLASVSSCVLIFVDFVGVFE